MAEAAPRDFLRRTSRRIAVLIILIGASALIGWTADVTALTNWVRGAGTMNSATAALFIIGGIALIRLSGQSSRRTGGSGNRIGLLCALVVALGGMVGLVEYMASSGAHLTDVLFWNWPQTEFPIPSHQMPPNTALAFVLGGAGLLLVDVENRHGYRPGETLLLLTGVVGLLALIGYAYRVPTLYRVDSAPPMALNSAAAFELLSFAALAMRPDRGVMLVLTSNTTAGVMARRLLPLSVLIPLGLGVLRFFSERHGYFEVELGIALFAAANMIGFAMAIWWNAKLLFRAEQERQEAIEQLKRTTAELTRSNTELQQFAYVASHDLSEPLRMVVSYLELLKRHRTDLDAESTEFIAYAVDGARRLQALIQDLLAYARVDIRGNRFQPTDCNEVLQNAMRHLTLQVSETQATIEHEPLPTVQADAVQLTQVFQNLIGNAIKFRGTAPPRVHVGSRRTDGEWVFTVKDNGIGIEPRNFDRVFALFQRLHTREEYPGTGMGLAICKKIIERHGGRIWVESMPGHGAVFSFTLPANLLNRVP